MRSQDHSRSAGCPYRVRDELQESQMPNEGRGGEELPVERDQQRLLHRKDVGAGVGPVRRDDKVLAAGRVDLLRPAE
jgi:hypothetical protein